MYSKKRNIQNYFFSQAYWADSKDVSDMSLLQEIGARFSVDAQQLISSPTSSATLRSNTKEAADRGAFGVPR